MSSPYIVSARKYRPSTFASVVGQTALTRTLKNAIESGRLAQAYLFCGPRGVGKTSCARIFAKTINCEHRTPDGEACGQCDSCRDFERGVSYNVIELDAASNNGVNEMRSLTEQVNVPPATGHYRVFIIDEVHMLSTGAFNAFLKTLEEPPSYAVFILATTEKNKVLPTILSRCQTYDFARITERDIAGQLHRVADAEGITVEDAALEVIARKADGAMRDALSIFDQVAAASGGNVTYSAAIESLNVLDYDVYFRFTDAFAKGDVPASLLLYNQVRDAGFDARFFVNGLAGHVRNLLVARSPETAALLEVGEEGAGRYLKTATTFPPQWYYKAMDILQSCDLNFREASDKQLLVELALIRLCQLVEPENPDDGGNAPEPLKSLRKSPQQPAPSPSTSNSSTQLPTNSTTPTLTNSSTQPPIHAYAPKLPKPPRTVVRHAGQSVRLSDLKNAGKQEQSQPKEVEATPEPESDREVSKEALEKAWEEYLDANTDKKLLLTAMRRSLPTSLGGNRFELTVYNQAQLQEAEMNLVSLAEHLRKATGCPSLTLSVREQAPSERPRHLSPAETLADMVRRFPATGKLLELIDAEQI